MTAEGTPNRIAFEMELVRIPKVSENLEEATIGKWLKQEGDPVEKEEPLVELLTDKADFELPSPASGILRKIVAPERSSVPVGFIIAIIASTDEPLPDVEAENRRIMEEARAGLKKTPSKPAVYAKEGDRPPGGDAAPAGAHRLRIPATPAARRLAKERGIELEEVARRLGKDAVITESDVQAYLDKQ